MSFKKNIVGKSNLRFQILIFEIFEFLNFRIFESPIFDFQSNRIVFDQNIFINNKIYTKVMQPVISKYRITKIFGDGGIPLTSSICHY